MTDPRDTTQPPPSAEDTWPAPPPIPEPDHEPFCIVRPVTFLPTPIYDLAAEDLEDDDG